MRVWASVCACVCELNVCLFECVSVWVFAGVNEWVSVWISERISESVCERLSDCVSVWYPSLSCCCDTIVSMCITSWITLLKTMRKRWRGMLLKKPFRRRKKNSSDTKTFFRTASRNLKIAAEFFRWSFLDEEVTREPFNLINLKSKMY